MKLSENFSFVYHNLLPELMEVEVPEEKWADCLNCHHCSGEHKERYHTKCCDYHPSIPNYVIGAILSDESPALDRPKEIIREKIANRKGVTPLGITPSLGYQNTFDEDRAGNTGKKTADGFRISLLCPFFNNGLCGIHKYRADICGSFFCLSVSGSQGKQLVKKVQSFSQGLDFKMALHIAQQLDHAPGDLSDLELLKDTVSLLENNQGTIENNYQSLWADYLGQEEHYYKRCFHLISETNADTAKGILGDFLSKGTQSIVRAAKSAHENLIPEKLFFHADKYSQWLSSQMLADRADSKELFFLRLFNGKMDTGKLVIMIEDFDGDFPEKMTDFLKHGILDERKPEA